MIFLRRTGRDPGDSRKENNMENKQTDYEMQSGAPRIQTRTLTGLALFTAIVIVLQLLGSVIRFGPFSISLVLIPIVVGAALYGPWAGAWLGFVFGLVVLLSGDAGAFMVVNPLGTIVTVLLKGSAAGCAAGAVYRLLEKKSPWAGAFAAAFTAPIVNTGLFLLGCLLFFLPTVTEWGTAAGFPHVGSYMIFGLVGGNFLFELLVNLILSPVIMRLIRLGRASAHNRDNR